MSYIEKGGSVEKIDGDVRFTGVVVAVYKTLSGKDRIVVECTIEGGERVTAYL